MGNAVGKPGEDVENDMLVSREDVAEVGAVEDVFEGGKDADPGLGADGARNESGEISGGAGEAEAGDSLAGVEENQPTGDGQEGQEELACYRDDQGRQEQGGNEGAEERAREGHDGEAEDGDDGHDQVLAIVEGPAVVAEVAESVSWGS